MAIYPLDFEISKTWILTLCGKSRDHQSFRINDCLYKWPSSIYYMRSHQQLSRAMLLWQKEKKKGDVCKRQNKLVLSICIFSDNPNSVDSRQTISKTFLRFPSVSNMQALVDVPVVIYYSRAEHV